MKLYYIPGACSLAPHIAAIEAGIDIDLIMVGISAEGKTAGGKDFYTVNPKGSVPALELDDGSVLTENAVVLQYVAAKNPQSGLLPAESMVRFRVLEMVNYIATEIHKGVAPMMNPALSEVVPIFIENLIDKFACVESILGDSNFLIGDQFTIADAYLFTTLSWLGHLQIDMTQWPHLQAYQGRIGLRPAVQQALAEEGLV
jgi:glutathione S-transferase